MKLKDTFKILLFTSLGVGILIYLFRKQEDVSLLDLWSAFIGLKGFWVIISLVLFFLTHVLRAIRWKMQIDVLGKHVPWLHCSAAMMAGYAINYVVPRSGEILKCGWLSKRENVPTSRLLGTVVAERIIDVICLAIVIGLALILQYEVLWGYLSNNISIKLSPLQQAVGLSFAALGLLFLFVLWKRSGQTGIYSKIWEQVLHLKTGLLSVSKVNRPLLYIVMTILIWAGYVVMHYTMLLAFAPTDHLTLQIGLMVFVFGSLGIVIPTPGGIGAFQALVTQALVLYSVPESTSFIFSNIAFWPFVVINVLLGIAGFIYLSYTKPATA